MKTVLIAVALVAAGPALAKQETFFIEKVAVLGVGQAVCGVGPEVQAMQIAIGSAMIKSAISKDAVIARAKKRGHAIIADIQKHRGQNTFCQAFPYYLENGFPR
jgi:hypothetical protein